MTTLSSHGFIILSSTGVTLYVKITPVCRYAYIHSHLGFYSEESSLLCLFFCLWQIRVAKYNKVSIKLIYVSRKTVKANFLNISNLSSLRTSWKTAIVILQYTKYGTTTKLTKLCYYLENIQATLDTAILVHAYLKRPASFVTISKYSILTYTAKDSVLLGRDAARLIGPRLFEETYCLDLQGSTSTGKWIF
jgi:hypothetical protein